MPEVRDYIPVESSIIKGVLHNEDDNLLLIKFNNGNLYMYENVSKEMYTKMMGSESIGKYFHANIKPLPTTRIL